MKKFFDGCNFLFGIFFATTLYAETISIRADLWCPYNCEVGPNPGFGIEIFDIALKSIGSKLDYQVMPWPRALEEAKLGRISGVIGASEDDIKNFSLKRGRLAISESPNCVYALAGKKIHYAKASDLGQFSKIGVISNYTYSNDIDAWLTKPENKSKLDIVSGEEPSLLNAKKLQANRIDAVIEDRSVMGYVLSRMGLQSEVVSVGCAEPTKIYIALGPLTPHADKILAALDQTIEQLKKSGRLKSILQRYGVK